jgi:hypothetical protein
MFDPKLSGIVGGIAVVLSLLIGFISGVGFPWLLIRALVFGVGFFVLSGCVYWLVTQFLPELLDQGEEDPGLEAGGPGSRVDISITGDGEGAGEASRGGEFSPDLDASDGFTDLVGTVSPSNENMDALSGNGLDQSAEDGYTKEGKAAEGPLHSGPSSPQGAAAPAIPAVAALGSESSDMVDELPDLELMADAFVTPSIEGGAGEIIESSPSIPAGRSKPPNLGGDFNVKEMASAIQTILKREDKG